MSDTALTAFEEESLPDYHDQSGGESLESLARRLGVPKRLMASLGKRVKNEDPINTNRQMFAEAALRRDVSLLAPYNRLLEQMNAKTDGWIVVEEEREVKEKNKITGKMEKVLKKVPVRVPCMVDDTKTQRAAIALYMRLVGMDGEKRVTIDNKQSVSVTFTTPELVSAAKDEKLTGAELLALWKQRNQAMASGQAEVQAKEEAERLERIQDSIPADYKEVE